jgi:protein-S-isoprenylcysteine O-methyltransferase Ste14
MALQEEFEVQGAFLFRWRSYLPLVFLVSGLGTVLLFPMDLPLSLILSALLIGLLGQFLRILAVGFAAPNTSGRNTAEGQIADSLNTKGLYGMFRHPLYVGNFLMWLSVCLLVGSFWFSMCFIAAFWLYYERIMYAEEQFLRRKFGSVYLDWAQKTPAFVPKNLKWSRPQHAFSWKRVLKKEKNGLFALLLLFWLFLYAHSCLMAEAWMPPLNGWAYAALASALLYLVLKWMKYQTHWLRE